MWFLQEPIAGSLFLMSESYYAHLAAHLGQTLGLNSMLLPAGLLLYQRPLAPRRGGPAPVLSSLLGPGTGVMVKQAILESQNHEAWFEDHPQVPAKLPFALLSPVAADWGTADTGLHIFECEEGKVWGVLC